MKMTLIAFLSFMFIEKAMASSLATYDQFDGGWRLPLQSYLCTTLEGYSFVVTVGPEKVNIGKNGKIVFENPNPRYTWETPSFTAREASGKEMENITQVRFSPGSLLFIVDGDFEGKVMGYVITNWQEDLAREGKTHETMTTARLIYREYRAGEMHKTNYIYSPKGCIVL